MKKLILILALTILNSAIASHTNIHFVHGANLNAKSWNLIRENVNFRSLAVDLPGRNDNIPHRSINLTVSAQALCRSLVGFDIVIVHSQGGAVVNHALGLCPDKEIQKIIYISAVVPLVGEKAFQRLSSSDEENYFRGITFNEEKLSMVITNADMFLNSFAPKASPEMKRYIWMNSTSEPAAIGDELVQFDEKEMNKVKRYYIRTLEDKIVSIESQDKMISNAGIDNVYSVKSGHLPMFTEFENLAKILNKIINK